MIVYGCDDQRWQQLMSIEDGVLTNIDVVDSMYW